MILLRHCLPFVGVSIAYTVHTTFMVFIAKYVKLTMDDIIHTYWYELSKRSHAPHLLFSPIDSWVLSIVWSIHQNNIFLTYGYVGNSFSYNPLELLKNPSSFPSQAIVSIFIGTVGLAFRQIVAPVTRIEITY